LNPGPAVPQNAGTISSACFCGHTRKQEYQSHLSCGEFMHANVKVTRRDVYIDACRLRKSTGLSNDRGEHGLQ